MAEFDEERAVELMVALMPVSDSYITDRYTTYVGPLMVALGAKYYRKAIFDSREYKEIGTAFADQLPGEYF
jgi:hypothetical protein